MDRRLKGCIGQGDQESIIRSINPVDNPVEMPRNSMNAHDIRTQRHEDSKHRVEVSGLEPPTSTLRT